MSTVAIKPCSFPIHSNQEKNILFELNVTRLASNVRLSTIVKCFDALQPEETFCILNDYDPKQLCDQLVAERGNTFTLKYKESGPDRWSVLIQKCEVEECATIGALAAADIRKAEVFKKFGLDFCCGGKKLLKQACLEKGLDIAVVQKVLSEVSLESNKAAFDFNSWQLDFLADYIYNQHHQYWYKEEPVLAELVQKVAGHHGVHHSELLRLKELFSTLKHELNTHFLKEEKVLFPHIKQLVEKQKNIATAALLLENIDEPLQMMEAEHEIAGELLSNIRKVTSDYALPAGACNSYKLLYHKLQSLEEDLHEHIHLENNILFPKAALLHKQLIK